MLKPIYLFSLPRSGSTLLQKLLSGHPEISTSNEPWLLLPFLSPMGESDSYADYNAYMLGKAFQQFIDKLPSGRSSYLECLHDFTLRLYELQSPGDVRYFLDKTPRYHLIADSIMEMFPEGKFILLWRNPLSVIASMIETWGNGRWNTFVYQIDLYKGLQSLLAVSEKYFDRMIVVNYESLVSDPGATLERIYAYLDLEMPKVALSFTDPYLDGRMGGCIVMGDPDGSKSYQNISRDSLDKWKNTLSGPLRKAWCKRYLRWLGSERLAAMGYNFDELVSELMRVPSNMRFLCSDSLRMTGNVVYPYAEPVMVIDKVRSLLARQRTYSHR